MKVPSLAGILRIAIAALIVALAVRFVRHLDWRAILHTATGANATLLALAGLGNIPLVWLKALRMRRLLHNRVGVSRLMSLFFTSYAGDNLLMSQAGVAIRAGLLRADGVDFAQALSAQVVEKLLEGTGLVLVALYAASLAPLPRWSITSLEIAAVAFGLLVPLLIVASRSRWGRRATALGRAFEVLRVLGDPRLAVEVAMLTMAAWIFELAMVVAVLLGLHLHPPLALTACVLVLATNVAALIPGLPANLGTFEASCVMALAPLGIASETALGMALVHHALHTIPATLLGLAGLWHWRQTRTA